MRIEIINEVEARGTDWFGLRSRTFVRLANGDWLGADGRRVGPEMALRFTLLTDRARVLMAQNEVERERGALGA